MAYQKLQVSRALVVIPSDTVDIPFPGALMISSTTTGPPTGAQLVDSAGDFINRGVRPGDIIYSGATAATVVSVDSATVLNTTTAVLPAAAYKLYQAGANEGCVLYVGTTGNVDLITAGGDTVLYTGVPAGMFMPVQVKRVKATLTGASTIVAQW